MATKPLRIKLDKQWWHHDCLGTA